MSSPEVISERLHGAGAPIGVVLVLVQNLTGQLVVAVGVDGGHYFDESANDTFDGKPAGIDFRGDVFHNNPKSSIYWLVLMLQK